MSEYQYHEWQTIDRTLSSEEQAAVSDLSSHIEVGPSRAVVTYHWGSFRHDPVQVLTQYFDAYFYLANWGSLRLMFCFPKGLLDEEDIAPYCTDEMITFQTIGDHQVLDLDFNPEDGDWGMIDEDATLAQFIRLRADLLDADYRLLYLAWLKAMTFYGVPDEYQDDDPDIQAYFLEPPVPPGLMSLSPSLQNFVQVFGIDNFLVKAAAEASPIPKKALTVDFRERVGQLPRSECNEFLVRLAEGDPAVRLALRKRLSASLQQEHPQPIPPRTIQQLLERARELEEAEKKRLAEAARQRHINKMKALAAREEHAWQEVETLLNTGRKIASVYDQATAMLEELEQLSKFRDTREGFLARLRQLAQKFITRPSLVRRWKDRDWM